MNRQPYNRSGFNRTAQTIGGSSGIAVMKMTSLAIPSQVIVPPVTRSSLSLKGTANATLVKRSSGSANIVMGTYLKPLVVKYGGSRSSEIVLSATADQIVQGEAIINLTGPPTLSLAPGDELIINTEEMTVTVNSQNGMEHLSIDSDFFTLLSGENKIIYSDTSSSRNILLDIIWKDRWL